jgi:hypothetical protein
MSNKYLGFFFLLKIIHVNISVNDSDTDLTGLK